MPPTYEEVERAIGAVAGVASASVGPATGTGRGRLRLRLRPGYDADAVSVAVADTLRQRFGIDVDPAAIRPRETGSDHGTAAGDAPRAAAADAPAPTRGPTASDELADEPEWGELIGAEEPSRNGEVLGFVRPRIVMVEQRVEGLETTATVRLDIEGDEHEGRIVAAATPAGGLRAVARATLVAIDDSLRGQARCELELLEVSDERVTAALTFLTYDGPEDLLGIALVREGDIVLAVVRATLDALNRRIGFLLREEPVLATH